MNDIQLTLDELKEQAERLGYKLVKANPYIRFEPCVCGNNRRVTWYNWSKCIVTLECNKCGYKVSGKNETDAKIMWNTIMREKAKEKESNND